MSWVPRAQQENILKLVLLYSRVSNIIIGSSSEKDEKEEGKGSQLANKLSVNLASGSISIHRVKINKLCNGII